MKKDNTICKFTAANSHMSKEIAVNMRVINAQSIGENI
jgi:hypothetical protein